MQHPARTRSTRLGEPAPGTAVRLARRISAGASLLLTGALFVTSALPAAAVPAQGDLDAAAHAQLSAQALEPVSAEPTSILAREDVSAARKAERVPAETGAAGMSPERLAELQAVADAEPAGWSYGGTPAFPRVWSMLETGYTQTRFPSVAQLPLSSGFGYRTGGFHGGTDVPLPAGEDIRPIAEGVVSEVFHGDNPGGGGYSVFIDHNVDGQFVQSWYGHMLPGSIAVEVGQVVDATTVIGQLGSSGRSTGPHLHLELKNSDYVSFDPVLWLQTRQMDLETSY
ncbi:peptidoglycan DD-metalloendopeptidase family protein [Agrococcus sp. Marseille-Q4369]|uniref:M23 family metallopeptidase n=1 Tax=Agrococcus sp. Marseille-Q4369 TaxID=2810513 RepID=UPI002016A40E|nr:peptidoglycan DD-metalloendopeptidase family protein [Agrococcus sp. Marseille-Q4369]